MKKLIEQVIKFGLVGVIATMIDYFLMIILTEVFSVPYLLSTTVSFLVSLVFNYLASMRFVFQHRENLSRKREFGTFVLLSIVGLLLNGLIMWLGVEKLIIDYRITKLFATAIVMIWNFTSRKLFLDANGS
jgi:putative flippase GtrA